jgi:hypothetical protein
MKELNSVQMGTAAGAIARLPRPVDFSHGRGCSRLRVEATIPAKNKTAGAISYTGAEAKKAIACIFATSLLKFGDRSPDNVDVALNFERAREMCIALSGDDFVIIGSDGVPKRMRDVADADVLFAAVAAGASVNLVVEFVRPFEVVRLGEDAYAYCPGASQMKQVQWEFVRGGTFSSSGNFSQGAAADLLFIADTFEAHEDRWAAVPRIYQQEEAGRTSHGPKAPVGLIAMWEYTKAGAATDLTLFTVERDGDAPLFDNVRASRVIRDALYTDPTGFYDVNALVTALVNLPAGSERADIPCGIGFKLQQTGTELNPARTAWLHIPARSEADWDELVGANVRTQQGIKLLSAAIRSGKTLPASVAALEPVIIAGRESVDFEGSPGRVYATGIAPTTHIPQAIVNAASSAVNAQPNAARSSIADRAAESIARALPGGASAIRPAATPIKTALVSRLGGVVGARRAWMGARS